MTIYEPDAPKPETFRQKLARLINCESMENGSGTPDFILAQYLEGCLKNFDETLAAREKWYGRDTDGEPLGKELSTEPLGPNPGGYNPR